MTFGATGIIELKFDPRSRRYYQNNANWRCDWESGPAGAPADLQRAIRQRRRKSILLNRCYNNGGIKMATIKIDVKKMAAYLERAGMDHVQLSRKIGRCDQYIQKCMKNGKMAGPAYEFMIRTLNLPTDAFAETEASAPPSCRSRSVFRHLRRPSRKSANGPVFYGRRNLSCICEGQGDERTGLDPEHQLCRAYDLQDGGAVCHARQMRDCA